MVQHFLHKSQFDAVLGTRSHLTKVVRSEHFFVHRLWVTPSYSAQFPLDADGQLANSFVGVLCAKRFAKRAVTRNLIKRQIYTMTQEQNLPPAAYVVRQVAAFDRKTFPSASSVALKRAVRLELSGLLGSLL